MKSFKKVLKDINDKFEAKFNIIIKMLRDCKDFRWDFTIQDWALCSTNLARIINNAKWKKSYQPTRGVLPMIKKWDITDQTSNVFCPYEQVTALHGEVNSTGKNLEYSNRIQGGCWRYIVDYSLCPKT